MKSFEATIDLANLALTLARVPFDVGPQDPETALKYTRPALEHLERLKHNLEVGLVPDYCAVAKFIVDLEEAAIE